jgi:hypothetical protein
LTAAELVIPSPELPQTFTQSPAGDLLGYPENKHRLSGKTQRLDNALSGQEDREL